MTTAEDTSVALTLLGSDADGDALTFTLDTGPTHGIVSGTPPAVIYTPDADFSGSDSFTFHVDDGTVSSQPATVVVTVTTAAFTNGGLEDGDFTGWSTLGETGVETAAFGSGPTEGTFQAFLSTAGPVEDPAYPVGNAVPAADLETFLGLLSGSLDDISTDTVIEGSALKKTFTAKAGDVVSFDWNFLTDENTNLDEPDFPPNLGANDLAFVTIVPLSLLADTFWTFSLSPTDFAAETGFDTFSFTIPITATYTLGIGVVDVGDAKTPSRLLVDNASLAPAS